ncbi:hypothetical protein SAMN05519103_09183 [Rhizobiales bacterium GAS113]|nr:hypothetical protein SAMN05519103_09183 [Rhizobiales bacterium GAS113]SEF07605.1 hypothetical protein SAMN05519104_8386 [Rhizobiales bacterium GAS188]
MRLWISNFRLPGGLRAGINLPIGRRGRPRLFIGGRRIAIRPAGGCQGPHWHPARRSDSCPHWPGRMARGA